MGFSETYSEAQREAVATAYVDRHLRPARVIVDLARRGELQYGEEQLAPFELSESSVRSFAARLRKRRAGEVRSNLADARPSDAIEVLRRRLLNATEAGLASLERQQRRARSKTDWEQLRQIARVVREIAALPQPGERGVAPGQRGPGGERDGGTSRGGLAGSLLAAHRARRPAPVLNGGAEASAKPVESQTNGPTFAEPDPAEGVVAGLRERLQATSDETGKRPLAARA